jgi:hypothetical protein
MDALPLMLFGVLGYIILFGLMIFPVKGVGTRQGELL